MSFETKFPELKDLVKTEDMSEYYGLTKETPDEDDYVMTKDIQKHCVSKQRVKEFIKLNQELTLALSTNNINIDLQLYEKVRLKIKEMEL